MESNTNRLLVLFLLYQGYRNVEISTFTGISQTYVAKIKSEDFRNSEAQKARIMHNVKILKKILSTLPKEENQE